MTIQSGIFCKKAFLITAFICLLGSSTFAQPKIGLTLSGGGAKGLAHIGILKAIDSAGLPVDIVTGTSMGSIVGGLYAAGYTADSIEKMARSLDWKTLLSNNVSMQSYIMEEKSEYGKYAVEFAFEKGSLKLPTGFLESQELWLKLQEVFFPVAHVKNFNQLPRPFRCIATDLATGNAVTLANGDLVTAIRASMAIPGIFSAVDRDNKRLIDGGVVRNFPVQDAIEMGAGFTIGVSVSTPLKNVEELDNALKILTQVVFLNEEKDRREESKLCNLLINIPMGEFTSGSFNSSNDIIDLGIEIGRQYYPQFKHIADSFRNGNATLSGALDTFMRQTKTIKTISVKGIKPELQRPFLEQLNMAVPADYSAAKITQKMRNAFAYRMYKNITYTLQKDSAENYNMVANAKPEATATFKAAVNYNTFMGIGLIGNITLRNFFTRSSRTLASLNIGDNFRGLFEHLQLFGYKKPWSNRTKLYIENQDFPAYQNLKQTGEYKTRYLLFDNQLLNTAHRRWSGGMGFRWEHVRVNPKILSGTYLDGYNSFFTLYGTMEYNSFETPFFPKKGFRMNLLAGYVMGLQPNINLFRDGNLIGSVEELGLPHGNYMRVVFDANRIAPIHKKWAAVFDASGGMNFGKDQSFFNSFFIGGMTATVRNQVQFAGLREGRIISESVAKAALGLRWNAMDNAYITVRGNSIFYDFIKKTGETNGGSWLNGAGLTLGYNLPIGPFEYSVMYAGKGAGWSTYLNLGFPFRIK